MAHAFLSPSGAPAWLRCHAKVWREQGLPDQSSEYADEGTAAHYLRDCCLIEGVSPGGFKGRSIFVSEAHTGWAENCSFGLKLEGRTFEVDHEMVTEVAKSIAALQALRDQLGEHQPFGEQQLPINAITGEDGATGTADFCGVGQRVLLVDDLKYGRGVQVFAEDNEQALIYGVAALDELDVLGEIQELWLHINQPRLNHFDLWKLSVAEARERIAAIRAVADVVAAGPDGLDATPGDKQCKFCRAKATCEEYRGFVLGAVADDFVDLDRGAVRVTLIQAERLLANSFGVKPRDVTLEVDATGAADPTFIINKPSIRPQLEAATDRVANSDDAHLATCMDALDLVEGWCKAVRAEVERRLLADTWTDGRYKLVGGKQGNRAWVDAADAEAAMKAMRLKTDEMYDRTVISPTAAERLLAASNPRKWKKLAGLITRTDGKPSVAPASDKRPALSTRVEFDAIAELVPATQAKALEDLI